MSSNINNNKMNKDQQYPGASNCKIDLNIKKYEDGNHQINLEYKNSATFNRINRDPRLRNKFFQKPIYQDSPDFNSVNHNFENTLSLNVLNTSAKSKSEKFLSTEVSSKNRSDFLDSSDKNFVNSKSTNFTDSSPKKSFSSNGSNFNLAPSQKSKSYENSELEPTKLNNNNAQSKIAYDPSATKPLSKFPTNSSNSLTYSSNISNSHSVNVSNFNSVNSQSIKPANFEGCTEKFSSNCNVTGPLNYTPVAESPHQNFSGSHYIFSSFSNSENITMQENFNYNNRNSVQFMQSYEQLYQDAYNHFYAYENCAAFPSFNDIYQYEPETSCQKPRFSNCNTYDQNYAFPQCWNNYNCRRREVKIHRISNAGYQKYNKIILNKEFEQFKNDKIKQENYLRSNSRECSPSTKWSQSYSRNSNETYKKVTDFGSRSRSYYSRGRCRRSRSLSRSRSRSKSGSGRYRSRSRSVSKNRDRSRSRSSYRSERSRSGSRCRSDSSRSRSRCRSERSRSRSRYRSEKSRSRSGCRSERSRSRSGCRSERSRSRSRYRSKRSESKSTYKSERSRSKSNHKYSRSKTRSRSGSKSRSRRRENYTSFMNYSYKRKEKLQDREYLGGYFKESDCQRQKLIEKWRMNNCDTQHEMQKRLQEISEMNPEEIMEEENKVWIRSAPADCYYERDPYDLKKIRATPKLEKLCEKFKYELLERGNRVRMNQDLKCLSPKKPKKKLCKHKSQVCSSSSESGSESETDDVNDMIEELQRKQKHPYRLHPELWYNDPGEMNDGPLCRCSAKARRSGIRHGFYAGENQRSYCDLKSNNAGHLYHYRITISPPTNFLTRTPTIINYDDHEFIFEGFSLISHYPIEKLPTCKVIRFNIEYIILYVEEKLPENFCIQELDLFYNYLFKEILELVDFDLTSAEFPDSCPQFHFMPRFVRELPENGRELLPMCEVLKYLLNSNKKLIDENDLESIHKMSNSDWQNFADLVKGMVVTNPGMKPCSLRVDQLDRDTDENFKKYNRESPEGFNVGRTTSFVKQELFVKQENICGDTTSPKVDSGIKKNVETKNKSDSTDKFYPEIVHFGIRPPQLSYAGNPEYQKAWRKYVKFRHLLANMPKPTTEDKQKLASKENCLHTMRAHSKMKRDVTVTVSSKGFYLTGLMCDVVQHAMLIPVLVCHLRFHRSLSVLEKSIGYSFSNRFLLQLALTHPSYRENFGTNSDHARNSLTNCGIRQPKYGDRRIHYMNTRKRGINTLINIMSRFGKKNETQSNIYHNERLEFLGDAVVEFITSIHLFHIFRDLEEGGLATYRAALVQNQHLAVLAKKLRLDEFMLYAHGSDLCHDLELKHAMANCFEALMGALFLDGGIEAADRVFGNTLYGDDEDCLDIWFNYPPHPLQEQEPLGDRKWIPQFPLLQKLTKFEEATGIEFKHIRLLARAFTDRSVGYTNLTLGSNQRLEFLGDSVLQLIASEYLYKYFPEHHEGHLSLLRSSLVNNKTQSVVCDDLGMTEYAVYANPKVELKIKDRADLLEAFLGALYVDSGLEVCRVFCDVCFFPRLQIFIMNQDWNDPKSKLQQCCLTLRTMDNVEPDIPIYKVVECKGPTNTRVYTVAVYFRNKRLADATGHSIQQAEMNAAQKAMETSGPLFPQLDHQKRVIAKSLKTQIWPSRSSWSSESIREAASSAYKKQNPKEK